MEIVNTLEKLGVLGVAIAGFSEATFLPVPMEAISIPIYLSNKNRAILYSLILIFFSSIGSLVGYFLGKFLGVSIIKKLSLEKYLEKIKKLYNDNLFFTILTSAFTPIPFEAYVLSAGVLQVDLKKFFVSATISRVIRHLPQGIFIYFYGGNILKNIKEYSFLLGIIVVLFIFAKIKLKKLKA
nr:VTT domain-containing protein [uncultured Cetobacterium sp.]